MNNHSSNCGSNEPANPIANPHARVTPTPDNPCGYPPFDMCLVPNYTNNQITHYYTTGAISATDLAHFHQLMKQQKVSLDLIEWDGASDNMSGDENNPV